MPLRTSLLLIIYFVHFNSSVNAQDVSILFIGNSLTYSNNLPQILTKIGANNGMEISTHQLCFPNYGLEDHWNERNIQGAIKAQNFDYVIFQQGPSSQAYGRSSLIEYGGKISRVCHENDSKPAYFMVWPSTNYYHTFDGVIKNHVDASIQNKAGIIPVGSLWKKYREAVSNAGLYASDGFHASKKGSFLAALTMFQFLFSL